MSFEVDFEPIGRRIPCNSGDAILDAAQRAGIVLNATCGGEGICGGCIVRVMGGQVSSHIGEIHQVVSFNPKAM